jgi:hypothetical protein
MPAHRSRPHVELTESFDAEVLAAGAREIARIRRRVILSALITALSAALPWYCVYGGVHGLEGPIVAVVVALGLFFWTPMAAALLLGALALLGAPLPKSTRAEDVVWLAPHPVWSVFRRRLFTDRRTRSNLLLAPFRLFLRIARVLPILQHDVVAKVGLADGRVFGVAFPIEEFRAVVDALREASPRLIVGGSREHRALFRRDPRAMSRALEVAQADAVRTIENASVSGARRKRARVLRALGLEALAIVVAVFARRVVTLDAFAVFATLLAGSGFAILAALAKTTFLTRSELVDRVHKHQRDNTVPAFDAAGVSLGSRDSIEPLVDVLHKPSSIVWAYALDAFDADPPGSGNSDLVVVATSAPRLYILDVGDSAGERVVDAIGLIAPHAELGASPERADLHARNPNEPPRPARVGDRQIVGEDCALCGERILTEANAVACDDCDGALHRRCADDHGRKHADAPYR